VRAGAVVCAMRLSVVCAVRVAARCAGGTFAYGKHGTPSGGARVVEGGLVAESLGRWQHHTRHEPSVVKERAARGESALVASWCSAISAAPSRERVGYRGDQGRL